MGNVSLNFLFKNGYEPCDLCTEVLDFNAFSNCESHANYLMAMKIDHSKLETIQGIKRPKKLSLVFE